VTKQQPELPDAMPHLGRVRVRVGVRARVGVGVGVGVGVRVRVWFRVRAMVRVRVRVRVRVMVRPGDEAAARATRCDPAPCERRPPTPHHHRKARWVVRVLRRS